MKILVLEVPALHLGFLGCYGNDWVGTPNIDRLAAEGVVLDQHIAKEPGRSIANMLSAAASWRWSTGRDLTKCFAEAKKALTGAAARDAWLLGHTFPSLAPPWNLDEEMLNSYCDPEEGEAPLAAPEALVDESSLAALQNTYAGVVTFLDAQIGNLLEEDAIDGDTVICLTASLGLPLGEHGFVGMHRPWLHDELVHVPCILRLPGAEHAGQRIASLTQPEDVAATLLDLAGAPGSTGQSLLPLLRGESFAARDHACTALQIKEESEWSLRTSDWAYLLPIVTNDAGRRPALFAKPDDRWEVNDVSQHYPELMDQMEKLLRAEMVR